MPAITPNAAVGVVGAGTMGSGIAQVAAAAGHAVILYDSQSGAAGKAAARIREIFGKLSAQGRLSASEAERASGRISVANVLSDLAPAGLVIEAVVEDLAIKRELFAALERSVGPDCVLATNTSSLSVTAIAGALRQPSRLVGMHFFNPVPLMELVEVIRGLATSEEILPVVCQTAKAWGKTPVLAASTPGFIVNRIARPFYGEALRLLSEAAAAPATIDAVLRDCGGFRMGPFELMDLIGNDVNLAVTRSVWEAFYGDGRYRPSLLQEERVRAGLLGRKSGRGFYPYGNGGAPPAAATEPRQESPRRVRLRGPESLTGPLSARLQKAGIEIVTEGGAVAIEIGSGKTAAQQSHDSGERDLVVVDLALDYGTAPRIAMARSRSCSSPAYRAALGAFQAAGFEVSPLRDVAGMVVLRTVVMLANEAADAVNQQVCTAEAADTAMKKGVNYPLGPLAWADRLGMGTVQSALRDLGAVYGEERYRVSPLIQELAWSGGQFHGAS